MYFEKELEIHKKIFPKANPEDQLMHLSEELTERKNAFNPLEFLEEWADCLFVAISLQRFEHTSELARIILEYLFFSQPESMQNTLREYLAKAIKKVKRRKYYYRNGHYEREKNVKKI